MNEFLRKLALNLFKSHKHDYLFGEKRFVYFAESKDPEDSEGKEEVEEGEIPENGAPEESPEEPLSEEVQAPRSGVVDQVHSLLDQVEYKLPPDFDEERLQNARDIVNQHAVDLNGYEKQFDQKSSDFIAEMGVEPTEGLKDEIWQILYSVVPEFKNQVVQEYKSFNPDLIPANLSFKLRKQLAAVWKKNSEKQVSARYLTRFIADSLKIMDKVAENEFEILKTFQQVKEVMWDMYDHRKKRHIEDMKLRGAVRYAGLPLLKGMEYTGTRTQITGWQDNSEPIVEQFTEGWTLKDVYINKVREIDPEDKKNKEKMKMEGVWVAIESRTTGQTFRMSINRFREFVTLHRIKPKIKKKAELYEHVPYLKEMNIELKPGSEIEYDEWRFDEDQGKWVADPKKVKIKYIDDQVVKLDQEVLLHSVADTPDKAFHIKQNEMFLGDFAKWLNRTLAVPTMNYDELQDKLLEHYELMNKQYKRNKECHDPIMLQKGEVIFADAPGNPLYQIVNEPDKEGVVKLSRGLQFTFPQFLKWVYEYGMEPYKPELEANKVKYYMKGSNRAAKRAEEDAENAKKHFINTGEWKDTLKKLKEKGLKGIVAGPELKIKVDRRNIPMKESHSYLRQFIRDTYMLDLDSIFQLFKTGYEYYTRNWRRRQKTRYSAIGKGVPWFGTEFERLNQQAENEEVDMFKQAMDQWGVPQIEETLYETNNRDQAKACFNVLAEKGQLRWDERRLWETINKFTDINHKIPMPEPGIDPYIPFKAGTGKKFKGMDVAGRSPIDFIPEALDSIWGESTYVGWKRQNDGALEDGISKTYNKAEELESDPNNNGGIKRELELLLERHLRGEYVDPSEFEGMLRFIVEAGKAGGKDKVYFLLMGTSAKYPPGDPNGRTIMGWDRVGRFISKYCNQFPALDFFSASNSDVKRDAETGEVFTRPWIKADFDHLVRPWVDKFVSTGSVSAPPEANDFMWKEVLTSDAFQKRLEKGIRNANAIDHDDSPYFIPALKESEIESACASSGGETKKFTVQGYKNAYLGFGLRLGSLKEKYDEEVSFEKKGQAAFKNQFLQKIIGTFQTFMKYDSILDNRYRRKEESRLQRFSSHDYQSGCVWDGERALRIYQKEMQGIITQIAQAYAEKGLISKDELPELIETPFVRLPSVRDNPKLKKEQEKIEGAIENFGGRFEKMIMKDKGQLMLEIVSKTDFQANHVAADPAKQVENKMKMEIFEGMRTRDAEEAVLPENPRGPGEI